MTEVLASLFGLAPDLLAAFFLVFLRIGSAMFVLPAFGEAMVPMRVRLVVAFAFSLIVFPAVFPQMQPTGPYELQGFAEVVTGLAIGLLLRLHVMAIQIAATIAAQSTSLAQLLGNNIVDPQPAIGLVLYFAALALAVELGLHVQFAMMFITSYGIIAAGDLISNGFVAPIRDAVAVAFQFGFILAAPFVAVSLLYNLALGVINRAMPQLMVAFVGAPAITFGALVLLALTAPLMLLIWVGEMQSRVINPFGVR